MFEILKNTLDKTVTSRQAGVMPPGLRTELQLKKREPGRACITRTYSKRPGGARRELFGGGAGAPLPCPRSHVPAPLTQSYHCTYDRNSSYAVVYNSRVFLTRNHKLWPPCASYRNSFTSFRYAHAEQCFIYVLSCFTESLQYE